MNHGYSIAYEMSRKSAELAERIAKFLPERRTLTELQHLLAEVEEIAGDAKPGWALERWRCWIAAARCFIAESVLSDAVRSGNGVADAKARLEILQVELEVATHSSGERGMPGGGMPDLSKRVSVLLGHPLPVLYWRLDRSWERFRDAQVVEQPSGDEERANRLPIVARLIVHIDDTPLVSPQEVRPETLYRLHLEAHLARWPQRDATLGFTFATTLAETQYSLSDFKSSNVVDSEKATHIVRATGILAFPFAQNDLLSPIVFAVSAYLLVETERYPIRIVGHDQLKFRIRREGQTLLSSGWPRMDAHVHDLLQHLCKEQPAVRDELDALVPLADALTAVLGTVAQGGVLKGRTNLREAEFQAEVLKLLRVRLGEDVQEAPKQAGGITDIRYRGCIVELKVEESISDREKIFEKYSSQPTQYQGVEARSVAILLVLDLTEKSKPPGDLRNDILLKKVEVHGDSGGYPSWVFMFVVRGNVRSPSSYSA